MSDNRAGKIQTVRGLIAPEDLGPTLMHEHLLLDINPPDIRNDPVRSRGRQIRMCDCHQMNWGAPSNPANLRLDDSDGLLTGELQRMKSLGGKSVVELTTGGLEPQPQGLRELSERSDVNIIMGCGYYVESYMDDADRGRLADDFAAQMIQDITVGAWGTDVKAGIIGEIGCESPWKDSEKQVMTGALVAQRETGVSLNVHPGREKEDPLEIMAFAKAHGAPVDRIIMSHIDRTLFNLDDMLELAQTGCVLEFDMFGLETTNYFLNPEVDRPNDGIRIRYLRGLIDHGHIDQITISHDICVWSRMRDYGGHGYSHIFENIVPLMSRRNFSEDEIAQITVGNPARLLTIQQ